MSIKKYFFQSHDTSTIWLPFFRISVSVFALFHFISIQSDFNEFFSVSAYISPHIISATLNGFMISIYDIYSFINNYIQISFETVLLVFRIVFPVILLFLCVGLFTRISALISLVLHLIIMKSIDPYLYGVDYFTTIALFYCFVFPCGRYCSVDNLIQKKNKVEQFSHRFYLHILQYHLCIVYFFSGFDKIQGITWRNGEAAWKAINSHNHSGLINLTWLADTPFFLLAGWGTVILELAYFIFINIKSVSFYWLLGICLMHLFIVVSLGLYFFSAIMIILNLSAYYLPTISVERTITVPNSITQLKFLNKFKLV